MALKDLMEDKQLNFNQPLLSVRRGSSTTTPAENQRKAHISRPSLPHLPSYKSELKTGPIRNPGVVPFQWECMPGRPKDENKAQKFVLKSPPRAPKLPPGRAANHMQKQPDELLRISSTPSSRYREEINISHFLESSPDKFLSEVEETEKEREVKDISSSEDENVTYADAQETFSRSESFFNCSFSGVSGLDVPVSYRVFSDPQTWDFMMDRFIPAAKAVASEIPSYTSRRHHVTREQEKPRTQVVKLKKQTPQDNAIPDIWPNKINEKDEEEDEDEEDGFDGPQELSMKFCGLMPRFCMLNPLPGMKDHVQAVSSVRRVRTKPAHAQACRDNKHRDGAENNRGDLKRSAHKYTPGPINKSLMNGYLGRYGMARQNNVSPQMFLDEEKQFPGLPGEFRVSTNLLKTSPTISELIAQDSEENTCLVKSTEEKTLYVDSVRMVESRHSKSSSSESRGSNPSVDHSLREIMSLCCDEKALLQAQSSEITYPSAFSTSKKSVHDVQEGSKRLQKRDEDVNKIVKIAKPLKMGVRSIELSEKESSALALTPFLPKSPSESWLSRALPSLSSRNSSSKPYLANHGFRASLADPKQRPLKTSNLQNMPNLSAGELAPISENK